MKRKSRHAAAHFEAPGVGLEQAVEHLEQGRLASAVAADEAQAFPASQFEADVFDRVAHRGGGDAARRWEMASRARGGIGRGLKRQDAKHAKEDTGKENYDLWLEEDEILDFD